MLKLFKNLSAFALFPLLAFFIYDKQRNKKEYEEWQMILFIITFFLSFSLWILFIELLI